MKKLILLLLVFSLSSCFAPYGTRTYHPAVNKKGHKAQKTSQQKLAGTFGRNMHKPNKFKKNHF